MKMRVFSLVLTLVMIACVCGCSTQPTDSSSETEIIETEITIIGADGSEITDSKEENVSSKDNVSSNQSQTTTSDSLSSGNTDTQNEIKIDYNKVVEVDICGDIVRGYLESTDARNQYFWLSTYQSTRADFQHITLEWEIAKAPYTVYMSENSDFSNVITVVTDSFEVKNTLCVPGKTYYWKVVGSDSDRILGGGRIKIKDAPVRWIYVKGVYNVRDMGGWETTNGKTVKYGMLYRGSQLNKKENDTIINMAKDEGIETLKNLGLKTEFDLRGKSDVQAPPTGISLNHVSVANHTSYHNIFSTSIKDTVVENYKTMFNYLSNESNYPIYAHCQGGADRTGTYAFLLNGLLGVSYDDLTRDFELTSFAGVKRWRGEGKGNTFSKEDTSYKTETGQLIAWGDLYNGMMDYGMQNKCTTLQESIEHWFVNYIGIPQSQIDSFKSIMLE